MKKQLIYLSLLFFSFFGFINVTYAASLSNQSGTNNLTPGATSCSGFPCYNSSFDGYANIGIRFTLINRETGAIKNGKHIDILTSGLANDLNTSPKSILSVPNNVNKIELVYSSGSKYGNYSNYLKYESMGIDANPDVITHLYNDSSVQKRLQSHMNNFNSIEVKSSSTSGNQFYAKILGDNKLITNYNNKNDDAGDIFNCKWWLCRSN